MERLKYCRVLALSCFAINSATAQATLSFPLKETGFNHPNTARFSSVFDHSHAGAPDPKQPTQPAQYSLDKNKKDSLVIAFTNERGDRSPDKGEPKCYQQANAIPFSVGGLYGWSDMTRLCYDNHRGVDYPVPEGTPVYAAVDGTIAYPGTKGFDYEMAGLGAGESKKFAVLELQPTDTSFNYRIYYLHLKTGQFNSEKDRVAVQDPNKAAHCPSPVYLPLPPGSPVQRGCLIGLSGNTGLGIGNFHLHFEVQKLVPSSDPSLTASAKTLLPCGFNQALACVPVDPYGWAPSSPGAEDPYARLTGVAAQRLWAGVGAWTQVFPTTQPSARVLFAMASDEARGQVVLFGGIDVATPTGGIGPVDDTWIWENGNWRQWQRGLFDPTPPAMWGHTMAYDAIRQKIVLFGSSGLGNATWLWNGNGWEQVPYGSTWPPSRANQAMAYDWSRGEVVLQGGQAHPSTGYFGWNDTWIWNGSTWIERLPITSPVPNWRHLSAMAWDPVSRKVVRFGGKSISCGGGCYAPITHDDTWLWDGTNWQEVTGLPTGGPLPREGHAMGIDPVSNRVMLVGGDALVSTYPHTYEQKSDTWTWTGTVWSLAQPSNAALRTPGNAFKIAPDLRNSQMILFTTPQPGVRETWVWR